MDEKLSNFNVALCLFSSLGHRNVLYQPRFKVAREFRVAVDAFERVKLYNCSNYLTVYFHIINIKKMKQKHLYKDRYFQHPHTRNIHLFLCRSSFLQLSNL